MPKIQIMLNQAGKPAGVVNVSREDLDSGTPIILTNSNNVGAVKWAWEFISVPVNEFGVSASSVLSGAATDTAEFIADLPGTYILQLTINNSIIGRIAAAVLSTSIGSRFPGIGEINEFGDFGWSTAATQLFARLDSYNLFGQTAGRHLDGYYPDPNVIGIMEGSGAGNSLEIADIPDGTFLKRTLNIIEGGMPTLQNCYDEDSLISIGSNGAVRLSNDLLAQRSEDIANANLRLINTGISGNVGLDINGYADTDFAGVMSRCMIETADIPIALNGAVAAGVLTIADPVDLTTISTDLLTLVELSGEVEGLFRFTRINATSGGLTDFDNNITVPDGNVVATFYYIRFLIGSDVTDSVPIAPGPVRANMITFGGFDDLGSGIGHLHYVYQTGGNPNEEFTKKSVLVDDNNPATDIAYETTTGEYHSQRLVTGVAPTAYTHAANPTVRAKNDGAGPAVQADDYVLDSEETGYIWIDLNSAHEDIGGSSSWEITSDTILNVGNANWQSSWLASTIVDGYHYIETSEWPEGMKLNSIEVDWLSTIAGNSVELYAVRQRWPGNPGDARVNLPLNSGYSHIEHAGDSARHIDTFTCDQNNVDWAHETSKLVIILHASELGTNEIVYGIRLNATYRSVSKYHTNTTTNPA